MSQSPTILRSAPAARTAANRRKRPKRF